MDPKYKVFEPLKSGCGMELHIHVIQEDRRNASAWQDAYPEMYLQVCRRVWLHCYQLLDLTVSLSAIAALIKSSRRQNSAQYTHMMQ